MPSWRTIVIRGANGCFRWAGAAGYRVFLAPCLMRVGAGRLPCGMHPHTHEVLTVVLAGQI